ncbi:class I SAM-dependent methyltransferase [Allokutzneria sp. A3M-2-11 16]|uniref:class I SAM-dependent methyltransferase n=1 Tax=Allokutzneria sp. A3M-2-11 16 TaxID=2962043 RepID=UPI0020B8E505|nr:class I SAM-dependent methyltransferase [Allokutzneria sp. A3M-2-11 16]MCP3803324.1 class I SAM-dependent methyltransferase [Allokutzneria sp. A3M-2-11 16]
MSAHLDPVPGQAVYSPAILAIYNTAVLRVSQPLAWRCPSSRVVALYDDHVSTDHLDIGVGTGYFLDRCTYPGPPRLTLLDMNRNSLGKAARRLARYAPELKQGNVMEPLDLPEESFGSVGMNCLLHCLPGRFSDKAVVFENIKPLMRPGAWVFGSTVLGALPGHNLFGRAILASYNRKGIWCNREDDLAGLETALRQHFDVVHVDVVGGSALFRAQR